MFKKISITLFVLTLFLLGQSVSAETLTGPAIDVQINQVQVDASTGRLIISVYLENQTSDFIGTVHNYLQIFRGEKLASEGDLFEPLTYYATVENTISELAPNELTSFDIVYNLPANFNPGSYFFKVASNDIEGNYSGLGYTDSPVEVAFGKGGMLSADVEYYFRTSNGDDAPMYGFEVPLTETPSILIQVAANSDLDKYLSKNKIYAAVSVSHPFNPDAILHTYETQELRVKNDANLGRVLEYKLSPWEGMTGNTYQVKLALENSRGESLMQPLKARWWVTGPIVRLSDILSQTNTYYAGDRLDVSVKYLAYNLSDASGYSLRLELTDVENKKLFYTKTALPVTDAVISFTNQAVKQDFVVSTINAAIIDEAGTVVYRLSKEFDTDKTFIKPLPAGIVISQTTQYVIVIFIVILFILGLLLLYRKRLAIGSILLVVVAVGVVSLYALVRLDMVILSKTDDNSAAIVLSLGIPSAEAALCSGGSCAQLNASIFQWGGCQVYIKASCQHCMNGVSYSISTGGSGSFSASDENDGTQRGPYGVSNATQSTANFSTGSHCIGTTVSTSIDGCYTPPPTNGACGSAANVPSTSAPTKKRCSSGSASTVSVSGTGSWIWTCRGSDGGSTASCSAPLSGSCGSANGSTPTSTPTVNLCNSGTSSAVSGSGPWSWTCAGSTGGNTVSCSAGVATNACTGTLPSGAVACAGTGTTGAWQEVTSCSASAGVCEYTVTTNPDGGGCSNCGGSSTTTPSGGGEEAQTGTVTYIVNNGTATTTQAVVCTSNSIVATTTLNTSIYLATASNTPLTFVPANYINSPASSNYFFFTNLGQKAVYSAGNLCGYVNVLDAAGQEVIEN